MRTYLTMVIYIIISFVYIYLFIFNWWQENSKSTVLGTE